MVANLVVSKLAMGMLQHKETARDVIGFKILGLENLEL